MIRKKRQKKFKINICNTISSHIFRYFIFLSQNNLCFRILSLIEVFSSNIYIYIYILVVLVQTSRVRYSFCRINKCHAKISLMYYVNFLIITNII